MQQPRDILLGVLLSLVLVCTGGGVTVTHCRHAEMGMMADMDMCCSSEDSSCMYYTFEQLEPYCASSITTVAPALSVMPFAVLPDNIDIRQYSAPSVSGSLSPSASSPPGSIISRLCILRI